MPDRFDSGDGAASTIAASVRHSRGSGLHAPRHRAADALDGMRADAVLPADIVIPSGAARRAGSLLTARHVLLTGATGFLGRWLAKEMIDRSPATVTCLVRPGQSDARTRLGAALSSTGLDESTLGDRVRVVEGDLLRPSLGVEANRLEPLLDDVDAICHCAATVSWALSYRALRAANVVATRELIRLAAARAIPFHLVSSVSVCYSTLAPAAPADNEDALAHLDGLHLGYARSKAVAEGLVREAGRRGLPITIYRPSFIAGDSANGAFNQDDILARVVSGCVRMGTAPDLDWTLDCLPVDVTARQLVDRSHRRGIVQLAHPQPRHWRECVLWMRLYGYDVRLVPYDEWLQQLERDAGRTGDRAHPLRPLRSFFLERPNGAGGLTLPEVMLGTSRRVRATAVPADGGAQEPPLDAALLQRYFDAFVEAAMLPGTARTGLAVGTNLPERRLFSRALGAHVASARLVARLSAHSIISELTAWRSGRPTGLFRYRLLVDDGPAAGDRDVVLKVKPADRLTIEVGEALVRLCDTRAGIAYARWADRLGLAAAHVRELAIYAQDDPRFRAHTPAVLGLLADPEDGIWAVVLEALGGGATPDAVAGHDSWTAAQVDCTIHGLAALQAIWYGREALLARQPWIGHVASTATICEMDDLWTAIAAHAAPRFAAWTDAAMPAIQRRLSGTVAQWWPALETLPRTLVHNDFNPRNLCLQSTAAGPRLAVYDWELACVGAPQRDLAELLCFVLPDRADPLDVEAWIEHHRIALARETGAAIDRSAWRRGFHASLWDLMLNRLPMYALIDRVRPQAFLPRVVRNWRRLYRWYPLDV
jgi:thioester reductase-like protein